MLKIAPVERGELTGEDFDIDFAVKSEKIRLSKGANMATYVKQGAVTGDSIGGTNNISLRSVLLTSGSGTATATIYGNGVAAVVINCPANDTKVYPAVSGGNQFSLEAIQGPVTIYIVGAGAFVRVSY